MSLDVTNCAWGSSDPEMLKYHDQEWGRYITEDQTLFEFLILEGAQAGLSWQTILNKRAGYRKAFAQFDVQKVARFSEKKIEKLMQDAGIVRNRLKIRSAVQNAQLFLLLQEEYGSFYNYSRQFIDGKPIVNKWSNLNEIPVTTDESDKFSKDLKKRGFKFVGSTIIYAYMQACGMVNDHLTSCYRYDEINHLNKCYLS